MIKLPFPPSTNALTGVVNGRKIMSKAYRAWREKAGWMVHLSALPALSETPYHLEITLVRPDKRPRDVNNYDKSISDLLVEHGITPDDKHMQSLTVKWADAKEGPTVYVQAG